MQAIYRYKIEITDEFSLKLPKYAQILSFQTQNGVPCIWVLISPDAETEQRKFRLFGTGHPVGSKDATLHFIGTTQQSEFPPLVWHLFEER